MWTLLAKRESINGAMSSITNMKANFLPDNAAPVNTLDEIFIPSETQSDEYRIKRSKLYNTEGELLDVILIHASKDSPRGFYMCLVSRPASSDGPFEFYMGHSLKFGIRSVIEANYCIDID
jgi:hypothetical protein